jgi:hypothetical protein
VDDDDLMENSDYEEAKVSSDVIPYGDPTVDQTIHTE